MNYFKINNKIGDEIGSRSLRNVELLDESENFRYDPEIKIIGEVKEKDRSIPCMIHMMSSK